MRMNAHSRPSSKLPSKRSKHPIGSKPLVLKKGSVSVKIYGTWNVSRRKNRTGQFVESLIPQFAVCYYLGDRRKILKFTKLETAKAEANRVLVMLVNGETKAIKLNGRDRDIFVMANERLRDWNSQVTLDEAITEYIKGCEELAPFDTTVGDAVREFVIRHKSIREPRMVPNLVEEFIEAKQKAGKSEEYMNSLRRLRRFAAVFQVPVQQITLDSLQEYFDKMVGRDGQAASPRTKTNYWRLVRSMLRYAIRRKYVPRDLLEELEGVELPDLPPSTTEIWFPDELREMLEACRPELIPWLTIAAFAGLRTAEIRRLDWKDVNLDRRMVTVQAQGAKTRSRRVVPLCDAAVRWLLPHSNTSGRLGYYSEENKFCSGLTNDVLKARTKAEITTPFQWRRNAFRHSFCSYRLAIVKNAEEVSLEAGNSPNMIFKHYRELVKEEDAKQWFSINPNAPNDKVFQITDVARHA